MNNMINFNRKWVWQGAFLSQVFYHFTFMKNKQLTTRLCRFNLIFVASQPKKGQKVSIIIFSGELTFLVQILTIQRILAPKKSARVWSWKENYNLNLYQKSQVWLLDFFLTLLVFCNKLFDFFELNEARNNR